MNSRPGALMLISKGSRPPTHPLDPIRALGKAVHLLFQSRRFVIVAPALGKFESLFELPKLRLDLASVLSVRHQLPAWSPGIGTTLKVAHAHLVPLTTEQDADRSKSFGVH